MANLSKIKRERMLEFLNTLKMKHTDDDSIRAFNEIANHLKDKKYGLVWEEHTERVDEMLEENIPVFCEDKDRKIVSNPELPYNFILEGDNLQSLYLLEKTHKGEIDVIYIDPPYNTGNSFIYDDLIVGGEDTYKHSKWASFIEKRLLIAKKLLSKNGVIFISIDDKEHAVMKLLCDEIFGESRFLTTIGWEKRTKCQNTKTARKMLQPKIEYILIYKNYDERSEFECHVVGKKEYPDNDDKGCYRLEEIGQMGASGIRGRGSMIFPILNVMPREGNQWKIGNDTVEDFLNRDDIIKRNSKVYRKIRPYDESSECIKPFWGFFSAEQYGTAESAKKELTKILDNKEHGFETVKPIQMIEEIIFQSTKQNATVLDFFAGSGSTAQAVLETNKDYGGSRKFIICTNNESNICEDITYPRVSTNITGKRADGSKYSDGIPANLKYFRCDWTPRKPEDYLLSNALCLHIKEMIELQNAIEIDNVKNVLILNKDDFKKTILNSEVYGQIENIWVNQNMILNSEELELLNAKGYKYIPTEFFGQELKEVAE